MVSMKNDRNLERFTTGSDWELTPMRATDPGDRFRNELEAPNEPLPNSPRR